MLVYWLLFCVHSLQVLHFCSHGQARTFSSDVKVSELGVELSALAGGSCGAAGVPRFRLKGGAWELWPVSFHRFLIFLFKIWIFCVFFFPTLCNVLAMMVSCSSVSAAEEVSRVVVMLVMMVSGSSFSSFLVVLFESLN